MRLARRLLGSRPSRQPTGPVVPLGCSEAVETGEDWISAEARRLLADEEIGGAFLIGEELPDVPPVVLAEMELIAAELERDHA